MTVSATDNPGSPTLSEAQRLQPQVEAKEALKELRALVRSLPDPARSQALEMLSAVSRQIPRRRPKREKTDAQFRKALRALMEAYATRVGESDWDGDLADMGEDVKFFEEQLGRAVRARNASGRHSWAAIGRVFGISHQGAYQKWHRLDSTETGEL